RRGRAPPARPRAPLRLHDGRRVHAARERVPLSGEEPPPREALRDGGPQDHRGGGGMRTMRAIVIGMAAMLSAATWAGPAAAADDAATHYKKGRSLYNVSEYRAALDEFKQAYVLHEDPAFLYNIAQCHRQLGNHREAITFYKRFLNESPKASNRKEIER